jgi:hypothetical protein
MEYDLPEGSDLNSNDSTSTFDLNNVIPAGTLIHIRYTDKTPEKCKIVITNDPEHLEEMKKKLERGKTQRSYKRIGRPGKSFSSHPKRVLGALERIHRRETEKRNRTPHYPLRDGQGHHQRPCSDRTVRIL